MLNMKSVIACAAGILIASAACVGQSVAPNLSRAELKKMIGEAHTAEQYRTLADYFGSQQVNYEQKAAAEKHEWLQLSQGYFVPFLKYPRPADAARTRYAYFADKAQQMNERADSYESLDASADQ